jgi:hypothetical protein
VRGSGALALSSLADNGSLTGGRRRGVRNQVFPLGSQWLLSEHAGNF